LVKCIPYLIVAGLIFVAALIVTAILLTRKAGTITNATTLGIALLARKEYTDSFYKGLKQKKTRSLSYRRCTLKK